VRDRLYYPNGIEVATDGQSLLIAETFRYRIVRLWIDGPRRGQSDVLAENLPGMPDGLHVDGEGRLFVMMPSRRSPLLSLLHRNPLLTRIFVKLPEWMRPGASSATHPFILVLDENTGEPIDSLHDPDGTFCFLSNMDMDSSGTAWFGSSDCGYVARLPLPDLPAPRPGDPPRQQTAPLLSEHY
jgi:hypothetical protein